MSDPDAFDALLGQLYTWLTCIFLLPLLLAVTGLGIAVVLRMVDQSRLFDRIRIGNFSDVLVTKNIAVFNNDEKHDQPFASLLPLQEWSDVYLPHNDLWSYGEPLIYVVSLANHVSGVSNVLRKISLFRREIKALKSIDRDQGWRLTEVRNDDAANRFVNLDEFGVHVRPLSAFQGVRIAVSRFGGILGCPRTSVKQYSLPDKERKPSERYDDSANREPKISSIYCVLSRIVGVTCGVLCCWLLFVKGAKAASDIRGFIFSALGCACFILGVMLMECHWMGFIVRRVVGYIE
jgi:hypothetical protein